MTSPTQPIEKLATGIPGFDEISRGGLPSGRTTLVAGSAGSGKTIFAAQILARGIADHREPAIFVTFEERPSDLRTNLMTLGWDIAQWEADGLWHFIDATSAASPDTVVIGDFDFSGIIARIEGAVQRTGARRVALDSIGAVFSEFPDAADVRREMRRVSHALIEMGVTAVLTAERTEEYGPIARHGVEEFVADDVVILRHVLDDEQVRRTIQILKYRGTNHRKGEFPFTIIEQTGVVVLPLAIGGREELSSDVRVTSGNDQLDEMCGGGFMRDSVTLISGATGTGKTLTVTQFLAGGALAGEKVLLFAFEESREQLFRNARGWGFDFEALEAAGNLKVIAAYPEVMSLEDHLVEMRQAMDDFQPNRVAIDSLSALEHIASKRGFRQFIMGITGLMKRRQITGLFTSTTPTLLGGDSITIAHISTLTDAIILLRYVEVLGRIRRGIAVLKVRGSAHHKEIREVTIDSSGMQIGNAFRDVDGILGGAPSRVRAGMEARLGSLFDDESMAQGTLSDD